MKPILLSMTLFFASCLAVQATIQLPDYIEHKGELYRCKEGEKAPLEQLFQKTEIKRPVEFKAFKSNLWRGHVAYWRVHKNQLWLVAVFVTDELYSAMKPVNPLGNYLIYPLQKLFPEGGAAVLADWYTGELKLWPHKEHPGEKPPKGSSSKVLRFKNGVLLPD